MTNAELIAALRYCISDNADDCDLCPYQSDCKSNGTGQGKMIRDAADALEAADKRIEELSLDCEMFQQKCMELEAQMPKEGEWIEYPDCLRYEGAYNDTFIACNQCGHVWSTIDNCTETFDYCPNCGARMNHKYCDVVNGCVMCDVELCNGKEKQEGER